MRNAYFTEETIRSRSKTMYENLSRYNRKRSLKNLFHTTALLVIDLQDYFLDPASHAFIPSAPAIVPRIAALMDSFKKLSLPVILTRHLNTAENAGLMKSWWRDLMMESNVLSEITRAIDTSQSLVIHKTRYDAFFGTNLEMILNDRGITRIVICGVIAHLCCETTARSAFMRGFEVFFTIDGTADYSQEFHQAALLNLTHGFSTPVLTDQILTKLNHAL